MQISQSRDQIFQHLSNNDTVITPNNRLSAQLLHDAIHTSSANVIDKPLCMPYQTFLMNCFKKLQHSHPHIEHPIILNAHQERRLWRQVLDDIPCNDGLLHEIQSAWTRCQQWQINMNDPLFEFTPQTQQFQDWHHVFSNRLIQLNVLCQAQLVDYLLDYPDTLCEHPIVWACFDDFTPQQIALQEAISQKKVMQVRYDIAPQPYPAQQFKACDNQDEIVQLSLWLQNQLQEDKKNIAVVVPDLQSQSTALQRNLQRFLSDDVFNISLGKPLLDYPLVSHALHWLALEKTHYSHQQIKLLLHSSYIGESKTECLLRAELLESSDIMQEARISSAVLLATLQKKAPALSKRLENLTYYPATATPNAWADLFLERLTAIGFPGEYAMDSLTYQCFERLTNLFDEFRQLSLLEQALTQQDALATFNDYVKATIFQPRIQEKPIQILGMLEASGCTFDSVWVCGLTDQCLPQKTKLSAFIPIEIQQRHNMPRANPEREWQLAKLALNRLHDGCEHIIYSYPCMIGDTPNLPSPLIHSLPYYLPLQIPDKPATMLIPTKESYLIPLVLNESISGGTTLLANQAKCPFRAFSAHRLHTKRALDLSTGPNDAERGQVIHQVMEIIWKSLGSQRQLLSLPQASIDALIEGAVKEALTSITTQRAYSFPKLVQSIEKQRLKQLALAELKWDKTREPFHVESTEQAYTIDLSGITLKVRIDRLDKADSGEKWVIDYKSSLPPSKPWNESRPEAPQLLLYALLDKSITTLLFLQLKTGQIKACGLSAEKPDIPGIAGIKKSETWTAKQQLWKTQLEQLAIELQDGLCTPTPQRNNTCQYCEFIDLCRR